VTLAATTLPANQPKALNLTISQNGRPAHDLGTYLGGAAHVVFINTSTLAYVHIHPVVRAAESMSASMMNMKAEAGPFLQMMLPALPAGTYKLWIQFRGANDQVYTAPFTIRAR
jgi:hypothetical protein